MDYEKLINNWNRMDKATIDIGLTAAAMSAMLEEIDRLRQRAEAAESKLILVDEYTAAKLNDPYNDYLTFDTWLQSRK